MKWQNLLIVTVALAIVACAKPKPSDNSNNQSAPVAPSAEESEKLGASIPLGNNVYPRGFYNTSPPAPSNGDSVNLQTDSAGALKVAGTVSVDTTALATSAKQDTGNTSVASIDGKFAASAVFADNTSNPTTTSIRSFLMGYDGPGNNWDGVRIGIQGAVTPFGFIDVLPGGTYNASDPAATTGQTVNLQVTPKGHLKVVMGYLFNNISTATTTTVKSGAGIFHSLVVNKHIASNAITIYDNTAGSGTTIATITPGTLLNDPPITATYDIAFATGLTIVTAGASNLTVSYQ